MPTSDPHKPLMAPPRAEPTINAMRVRAGWMSTEFAMIFGETKV